MHQVRDGAQIADVEKAVVRRAVVGGEASPIHAEDHRQVLQADIVHDGIEGALQKRGIDGAERFETLCGQPGGEQDRMLLGDPHIEILVRMMRLEAVETGAVGHGGGDGHHLRIEVGQLHQGIGEHLGVRAAAQRLCLAGFGIVGTKPMKLLLLLHGRLEAFALLGEHVQQHGTVLLLEKFERFDQRGDVVPVDGAKVLQPQVLEDDAGPQHSLGDLFGFARHAQGRHAAHLLDEFSGAVMQIVELRAGDDLVKVAGDRADILVDGPLVIVQDHNHPLGVVGDIIQGLVRNPASEGRVSGHRDHVFLAASLVAGDGHAERRRERRAGVPCAVAIVRTFGAQHEPVQAARSAYGVEPLLAPGQQLVHVGLVAYVKQQAVARGMEYVVQRDGEFHHAQVRAKMPAVVGKDGDQPFAYFRRQLLEFGKGELLYLLGRINTFEYACHSQRESAWLACR